MKEEKDMEIESLNLPFICLKNIETNKRKHYILIAFMGLFSGLLFILIGFIFFIIHSVIKVDSVFDEIGTTLIFLSYPLLFIGGHFMDKASENRKK